MICCALTRTHTGAVGPRCTRPGPWTRIIGSSGRHSVRFTCRQHNTSHVAGWSADPIVLTTLSREELAAYIAAEEAILAQARTDIQQAIHHRDAVMLRLSVAYAQRQAYKGGAP